MKRNAAIVAGTLAMLIGLGGYARGQDQTAKPAPAAPAAPQGAPATPPQARPADVDSVEHILAATYDVISGPPGQRDWDRFRSLFSTGARLVATGRNDKGNIIMHDLSVEDYVKAAGDYLTKNGFFENSIANRIESWDHMAEVWSTYESRHAKGEKPFARGVNSFQLFFDGTRWWVVTIYWEDENADHPLPEKYLSNNK